MFSKFYHILGKKNKNKVNFFLFLNLLYFILEFFSLTSLPLFFSFMINPNFITARLNGKIVGILPFFAKKSQYGLVVNSLPFFGSFGGIVSENQCEREILSCLNDFNKENDVLSSVIITNPFVANYDIYDKFFNYNIREKRRIQCIKLQNKSSDDLWINFDKRVRNAIRKYSKQNIQIIQNGIRAGVYKKSNSQYVIGSQDYDSLKIIMRSIFLQHSVNQPSNYEAQINELNKIVLDYCIQQVYSEAQGYMKYINDVSTLVVPIAHPIMANNNDKQLELKPWF